MALLVERDQSADSSGVDRICFFEIKNDAASMLPYRGAQQGGLIATNDSSDAVEDGSFSEFFNGYVQHDWNLSFLETSF
jgi:hypothetical protein